MATQKIQYGGIWKECKGHKITVVATKAHRSKKEALEARFLHVADISAKKAALERAPTSEYLARVEGVARSLCQYAALVVNRVEDDHPGIEVA